MARPRRTSSKRPAIMRKTTTPGCRTAMDARRDPGDAARQAEMARLEGWLRDQLASGPMPAAVVKEAAARDGIALHGRGVGLSLHDAAGRVGVVALVKRGKGADRW